MSGPIGLPRRIVSGGQTGVDRAALDVARELGIPLGGWIPRGRLAEDGPLDDIYPLTETPSRRYAVRTLWNVRDSDATLLLTRGPPTGGTALTRSYARNLGRPFLVVDLLQDPPPESARAWLSDTAPATLNVAGPRESSCPGIHAEATAWLRRLLQTSPLHTTQV